MEKCALGAFGVYVLSLVVPNGLLAFGMGLRVLSIPFLGGPKPGTPDALVSGDRRAGMAREPDRPVRNGHARYGRAGSSRHGGDTDGINPLFLQAMAWMRNNTRTNATVWAIWPDGSVVEGWANRTSYMDSVGGENGTRIYYSAQFLFNTSYDTQYLRSIGKPDYIVSRGYWYQELGGLAVEGNITNASMYGFALLSSLNISQNATARTYYFSSYTYPYYKTLMIVEPQQNGTSSFNAYLGTAGSSQYVAIKHVLFFNSTSYAYSLVDTKANDTLNYTLLVSYSGNEVSGGVILGPALFNSNIFRLTFLCNYQTCPYGDANTSLTAVYINGDTRIFRVKLPLRRPAGQKRAPRRHESDVL